MTILFTRGARWVARTPCTSPQARHRVRSHRVFVFVWNRAALEEADQQERYREARDREAAEDKPDRKVVGHDKDGWNSEVAEA